MGRDQAATRWLGFRGLFCGDSILGAGLAAPIVSCGARALLPHRASSDRGRSAARRLWSRPAPSASTYSRPRLGDARPHGHAARFDPVRDRLVDLGENSEAGTWKTQGSPRFFLLLSAGMLIKGPIVYAFLLPGIVAFQWRNRGRGEAVTAWCGWWPWLASLAHLPGSGPSEGSCVCPISPSMLSSGSSPADLARRCIGRSRSIFICRICSIGSRPGAFF